MAQHDVQFGTATEATPPHDPYSRPLTTAAPNGGTEDPEEWEYEYSTTETEVIVMASHLIFCADRTAQTYYVTLDLTTPQKPKPQDEAKYKEKPNVMGGIWVNNGLKTENAKRMQGNKNRSRKGKKSNPEEPNKDPDRGEDSQSEKDEEDSPTPVNQETGNGTGGAETRAKKAAAPPPAIPEVEDEKPTKVQILDLHSNNPIVSYGGDVFTCEWSRNIGTEFLFIEHDDQDPLPVLRNLREGVDLIAASSIRIMSKPVLLEPKFDSRRVSTSSGSAGWVPEPVEPVKSDREKRQDQASFLAQLREIKQKKGEEDDVTMITKKQLTESGWRAELNKRRAQERASLKKVIKARRDMGEVEKAKQRLEAMDEEDKRRKTKKPLKKASTTGRKGKPRSDLTKTPTIISRNRETPPFVARRGTMGTNTQTPEVETPTAQNWGGDGVDEMIDEEMREDDLYDDDAPFEDNDTHMDEGWE
jgi:hypothetical protein